MLCMASCTVLYASLVPFYKYFFIPIISQNEQPDNQTNLKQKPLTSTPYAQSRSVKEAVTGCRTRSSNYWRWSATDAQQCLRVSWSLHSLWGPERGFSQCIMSELSLVNKELLIFIFGNHFILDRVELDPGKAGGKVGVLPGKEYTT